MTKAGEFNQAIIYYVTDHGVQYTISQKLSVALLVGNHATSIRSEQGIPERWKFRYIILQKVVAGKTYKRKIVIGRPDNPLFRGTQRTVNIQGEVWMVTTRKGESARGPRAR